MYICVIMYCTCPMQSQLENRQHSSYQHWTSCNWYALPQLTLARPLFYMVTFLVMVKLWEIFANIWVGGVRDTWWWWWWCWTRGSDAIATAPKCQIPEAEHKWQILQLLPCKTKDLEHKLERQDARYASPAIFAVIFRATHSVAYHNVWRRGRAG